MHRLLFGCAALAIVPTAFAQSNDSAGDLKAQVAQMRQQMQAQQAVMQKMQQRLDELEAKEEAQAKVVATPPASTPAIPSASVQPTPLLAYTGEGASNTPPPYRPPSAPAGVAEPLPEGYVRLGDTGNLLKLDLVAQLDTMIDNTHMGSKDLFVPSSIPVRGQPFYNSGWNTNLSARQSIFRMDFRRDTDYGVLKVVYKNNFFGSGTGDMPYNMQFFYGELENERYRLLVGYNISAFTDIDVFPNTLDYEGPNSFNFKYGPQLRFVPVLHKWGDSTLTMPMSMEKPNADITTIGHYSPYSRLADFTLGLRWETPSWHVQWSNLYRDLGMEDSTTGKTQRTNAFATQLTGSAKLFKYDSVQGWFSNGHGFANFLQDISGLGLDAAFNNQGVLRAIRARGWGMGYTHGWTETLSSSASYGYLRISPSANMLISDELPKSTKFASLNLAWQFSQRAMVGIEYLWGQNIALTDMRGQGQRVQTTLRYDLNP
ncbi:DcaP family trimeric outer membrane transporter [Dyella sp. ASV21]|uniref:DcaP family trimeric outer membrane transporter n=1 Tax=Dyella sp. ASV21 TaxID=2795114 RepID=UPI0018EDC83C|nr:DcaP family trimeric outer membrane transporter [Dyella sp. ASV21]